LKIAQTTTDKELIKVLLVEDNVIDRKMAQRALVGCSQPAEFAVKLADSLSEAIKCLNTKEYQVVLLDLRLPDSSGIETVQRIHEVDPHVPIIVLTGTTDEESGLRAIENGATDYLAKSQPLESLLPRTILYALARKKAEDRLRESEGKYRAVIDNIAVGVALISPDMEVLSLNSQMKKWFPHIDTSKRPICFKSFNDPPRDGVCSYCPTCKTLRDGLVHQSVTETPSGDDITNYRVISSPIKDCNGDVTAAIEMVEDITEQRRRERLVLETNNRLQRTSQELLMAKQALEAKTAALEKAHQELEARVKERTVELSEANERLKMEIAAREQAEGALRASEANLHKVIVTSPDGIIVVDKNGVIQFVNPAAESLFGHTARELTGELFGLPLMKDEVTEVDVVRRGKEPGTAEMRVVETEWNGRTAFLALLHDVTESKLAKERIVRAAREWRTTFDSITDMISIHDKDCKITRVNKALANAFEREPKELIGKTCYEVFHGAQQPCPNCPHIQTIRTGEPAVLELFEPRLGIHLDVSTSPVFDENDEIMGSVHIAKDNSRRKQAEEALKKANERLTEYNRLKDEFVSTASHELRTPLSVIMGAIRLVLDEIPGKIGDEQREVLYMARDNVQRLSKIVNSLLSISKIESGKLELQKTVVNICKLTANTVSDYASLAEEKGVRLDCEVPEHNIDACVDSDRINEVLTNLISNSLKFTPEGGWVKVICTKQGDGVLISVQDSGIGIAKEDIPKLFDKFTQFGRKAGPGEKGTGLGLAIAKKLVEMHGGRIDVKSEINKGTTFTVTLPLTTEATAEALPAKMDELVENTLANN